MQCIVTIFMQQLISTLFKGRKNIMWMVSHWPNFPTFFGIHQAMTEQRKWCCNVLIQWTLNQQQQEDAEGTAVISNHTYKAINSWVGNCELAIFITIKVTSVILIKDRHHIKFSLSFIVGNLISKITRTKLSTAELGIATWRSFHDSFSFCRDTTLKDWYLWSSLNPLTIFHMLYTNLGQQWYVNPESWPKSTLQALPNFSSGSDLLCWSHDSRRSRQRGHGGEQYTGVGQNGNMSFLWSNILTQPDLLPDEQVICQADRVVTYSTGSLNSYNVSF